MKRKIIFIWSIYFAFVFHLFSSVTMGQTKLSYLPNKKLVRDIILENDVVKYQLAKASTSIGANYEEAQGACSRNDFKYKIGICFRESKESNYWLRIIKAAQIFNNKELDCLIQESSELKNIFASLLSKLRVIARRAEGPTKQSPMEIEIASCFASLLRL